MSNLAYLEEMAERAEELIDGEFVMPAPAATNHSLVSGNIHTIFRVYLKGKPCRAIPDGTTVFLTDADHFVPDMMVVCDRSKIRPDGVYGAPDLVVEVLSPSTAKNDKTYKKKVYGQCGVREYWLVNPRDRSVEVYRSDGNELVLDDFYTMPHDWELETMSEEERADRTPCFKCSLFDDLDISLGDVFDDIL